jgi:hypothetical protein|tara:strand:+ start:72 stop:245 length:174 start_codon:yes stop_codon:yes gene_type:complete
MKNKINKCLDVRKMNKIEINRLCLEIENFILYFTSDDKEQDCMMNVLIDYKEECLEK